MSNILKSICLFTVLASTNVLAEMVYPYIAPEARKATIMIQYTKIRVGDTVASVLSKLSNPDEVLDVYEPKKHQPKIIGKTFWYIIQRKVKSGSVKEKDEKLVRISFDLQGKVIEALHWGF